MEYNSQLKSVLPCFALNAFAIQALTVRSRFMTRKFTQKVDSGDWFLQNVMRRLMLVGEPSKGSDKELSEQMQVYVDLNRNYIENIAVFGLLAFGVALTVPEPSAYAVTALSTFTLLCYAVLAWEMYSS